MNRYVAFLRAMNIGGRRVTNEALRAAFGEMDFADVSTFRASGNVIFGAADAEVSERIEAGLAKALGFEVKIFLRSAVEVKAIAEHEPFDPNSVEASTGKLQVALLPDKPRQSTRKKVLAIATEEDLLAIRGRELYWLPSGGTQETVLDLRALEGIVGPWTMRTKGTIDQIATRHCAS